MQHLRHQKGLNTVSWHCMVFPFICWCWCSLVTEPWVTLLMGWISYGCCVKTQILWQLHSNSYAHRFAHFSSLQTGVFGYAVRLLSGLFSDSVAVLDEGKKCPPGQEWMQCMMGAVSCMDLTLDLSRNCTPGCRCPQGTLQQVNGWQEYTHT